MKKNTMLLLLAVLLSLTTHARQKHRKNTMATL